MVDTTAIVLLQLAIASVTGTQAAQVGVAGNDVKYHHGVDLVWADADYSNSSAPSRTPPLKGGLAFLVALRFQVVKRAVYTLDDQNERTGDELDWIVAYLAKNVRQLDFPHSG